jgi:hypothetical protein
MPAVNLNHEPYDVRVDRKSKWGNTFIIGRDGDRDDVCDKHKAKLWQDIKAGRVTLEDLARLRGKRLGCHCHPLRCHADTLSAAADWAFAEIERRKAA